jgi:sec-independent protein translocase protein TatB
MFGVDSSEFLLIAIVALVVIGPKDLPKAMRVVGYWVGKARGVSRSFRQGFDNMVREAELEEMEKRWAAENARIMAEHPASSDAESLAAAEPDVHDAPSTIDTPVMVEKPVVAPAPDHRPAPRPDVMPS